MSVANLEKNVYDRIVIQLKGINGSGNYNFDIHERDFHAKFKMVEELHTFPSICMGTQAGTSNSARRDQWEINTSWEIWGYVKDHNDPIGEANKLLSDIRIAICGDEHINSLVTELNFTSEVGAMSEIGVVLFIVKANLHHVP